MFKGVGTEELQGVEQGSDLLINLLNGFTCKEFVYRERRDFYIVAGLEEVNFTNREGNRIRKKCAPKSVAFRGIH